MSVRIQHNESLLKFEATYESGDTVTVWATEDSCVIHAFSPGSDPAMMLGARMIPADAVCLGAALMRVYGPVTSDVVFEKIPESESGS